MSVIYIAVAASVGALLFVWLLLWWMRRVDPLESYEQAVPLTREEEEEHKHQREEIQRLAREITGADGHAGATGASPDSLQPESDRVG